MSVTPLSLFVGNGVTSEETKVGAILVLFAFFAGGASNVGVDPGSHGGIGATSAGEIVTSIAVGFEVATASIGGVYISPSSPG